MALSDHQSQHGLIYSKQAQSQRVLQLEAQNRTILDDRKNEIPSSIELLPFSSIEQAKLGKKRVINR